MNIPVKKAPFYTISVLAVNTRKKRLPPPYLVPTTGSSEFVSSSASFAALSYSQAILNRTKALESRLLMIKSLDVLKPGSIVSILNKIIKSANGSNEHAEVIEAALKKLAKLKEASKPAVPSMERLLDRKAYNPLIPVKKAVYEAFLSIEPENKVFLESLNKAADSPFESAIFKRQIRKLFTLKSRELTAKNITVDTIRKNFENTINSKKNLPSYIMNRVKLSRTITNPDSKVKDLALPNFINAFNYVIENKNKKPAVEDLININRRLCDRILRHGYDTKGIIRGTKGDPMPPRRPSVKFIPARDVPKRMKEFERWFRKNYETMDTFELAARVNQQITEIHPFYDGNGRSARLFTDMVLASKGYFMKGYTERYLLAFNLPVEETAKIIKNSSVPIAEMKFHK